MAYDEKELEERIRLKAYEIWLEEGRPQGRDKEHWELAKFAIAQQDGLSATLLPPEPPRPEPVEDQAPGKKNRWRNVLSPSTNRRARSKAKAR
jgi:hypothetical protein